MGNFMRRTLAFILGMVFSLVLTLGGIAGGAYWAYKNLTLGTFTPDQESEISSWTIEDLTAFVIGVANDPQSITLELLEDKGFDIETTLGLDFSTANPQDVESLKSLAFASLASPTGLSEVDMGILFLFLPKNAETGRYPVFSEGARSRLRQFNLGDFVYPDANGVVGAANVLRSMKLGSILSDTYVETYSGGEYTYSSEDRGLNLLGNIQLGLFTALIEGKSVDIGYEIMEGYLSNLKTKSLAEIIASFGATDDETYSSNLEKLALIPDVKLQDAFIWNEENSWYELDISKFMSFGTVGSLMGISACTKSEGCPVHSDVSDCDGELYENGVVSEQTGIMKAILKGLANVQIMDLMTGGVEFDSMFDDILLGDLLGYDIDYPSGECEEDCTLEHEHVRYSYCKPNCDLDHKHNYYFVSAFEYVGDMMNELANKTFGEITSGGLDITGIIEDTTIGEVMGYKLKGGEWVDENEQPVDRTSLVNKILYQLYPKNVGELSSLTFEMLVADIELGEVFGYVKCNAISDSCPVHTDFCMESAPYWYDGSERVSLMYNVLSNIKLSALSSDDSVIQDELSSLFVGDLMGYTNDGSGWVKLVGGVEMPLDSLEEIIADISLFEVFNGSFNLQSKINGLKLKDVVNVEGNQILSLVGDYTVEELPSRMQALYVGEIMGYEKRGTIWWDKTNDKAVTGINYKLSNLTVSNLSDGGFDTLMDGILLGDVMSDYTSGAFSLLERGAISSEGWSAVTDANNDGKTNAGDVPINQISKRISEGIKTATFHDLIDAGLITDNGISAKLDTKLGVDPVTGDGLWWPYTVTEIIDKLIDA